MRLRALVAEMRVCAPPDSAERLAEVGVPLMPIGRHHAGRPAVGDRATGHPLPVRDLCPIMLPSAHHPRLPFPGRPFAPDVTDNRALWDLDVQSVNALFGAPLNTPWASIDLPPVDRR